MNISMIWGYSKMFSLNSLFLKRMQKAVIIMEETDRLVYTDLKT